MLASITPLGERGRHARWGITASAFLIGAALAGAALGAVAGAVGAVVLAADGEGRLRLGVLAAGAAIALVLDAGPLRVPGPRRQVDERWRSQYRGWVYGLGYGVQLGVGVATIVSSAATYVMLLAAVLSASPSAGAVIVGLHGLLRGLTPLLGGGVQRPDQLVALHRALERWRAPAARAGWLFLVAIVAFAVAGSVG